MTALENRIKLRQCRKLLGLTQAIMAQKIGISLRTYVRYESYSPTPPILSLAEHMAEKLKAHQTATEPGPLS